ncbi:MAG TPA: ion transporter [Phycisphaerae bacterium]|nr:ion transporter [Phycisphaerae bacterium]HOJ74641.1 ion transporter [Phycisphaerae bacterium]HPU25677.1 ion transporter [Phycisphaerae bacterium]HPZ99675.1 ion transporter [Phycisphaerae bacterium]HQE29042.1 ion transporter [Phycisphaerae bacterium]
MQLLNVAGPEDCPLSRAIDLLLLMLIISNVAAVMLETVDWIAVAWRSWFRAFELLSVTVFTLEYVLRVWSATADPRFAKPITGRIRFAVQPLLIIDLLAFLPFYLAAVPLDLRTLRALRLLRLARTLKIGRYSESLQSLGRVFVAKREELFTTLLAGLVLLVVASTLIYYVERDRQPETFSSIPAVMWWGVATLTTVGYGDMYPETVLGRVIGAAVAVLGIGLFAVPAGILGSGFVEQLHEKKRAKRTCPHCGKPIDG